MKTLYIIRGVPGSGKSTYARNRFPESDIAEADNYFVRPDGRYDFNPRLLKEAHEWCFQQLKQTLESCGYGIVANTFTRKWEMQKYLDLALDIGAAVEVIRCSGNWQNVHGVPEQKVKEMSERFEHFEGEYHA